MVGTLLELLLLVLASYCEVLDVVYDVVDVLV